jgi:hypothetical protein
MLIVQKLGVLSPPAQPQTTNSGTGWKPRLKHSHSKKTTFAYVIPALITDLTPDSRLFHHVHMLITAVSN